MANLDEGNRVRMIFPFTQDVDNDDLPKYVEVQIGLDPGDDGTLDGNENTEGNGYLYEAEPNAGTDLGNCVLHPGSGIASIAGSTCRAKNKGSQISLSYGTGRIINNHRTLNRYVVCTLP